MVNAAGAWADRIAALLRRAGAAGGNRAHADGDQPVARLHRAGVVILRGRKLSFKQLANGTVVIGGGHGPGVTATRTAR